MYKLEIAIHRGTLTSRDVEEPKNFETYDEAVAEYRKGKAFYRSIGYQIWYATITAPDGAKTTLEQNSYR